MRLLYLLLWIALLNGEHIQLTKQAIGNRKDVSPGFFKQFSGEGNLYELFCTA